MTTERPGTMYAPGSTWGYADDLAHGSVALALATCVAVVVMGLIWIGLMWWRRTRLYLNADEEQRLSLAVELLDEYGEFEELCGALGGDGPIQTANQPPSDEWDVTLDSQGNQVMPDLVPGHLGLAGMLGAPFLRSGERDVEGRAVADAAIEVARKRKHRANYKMARDVAQLAMVEYGVLEMTRSNELVLHKFCRDYMVKRGVRPKHMIEQLPLAVQLAFIPTESFIDARKVMASSAALRKHREWNATWVNPFWFCQVGARVRQ